MTLNVAHRGASAVAPENTMAAFEKAVELGADAIELDLHVSHDGELVIIHDDTLDRTTDGQGPVHTRSLHELKQLDAGRWFSERFAGQRIPTLAESWIVSPERSHSRLRSRRDQPSFPASRSAWCRPCVSIRSSRRWPSPLSTITHY